MNQDLLFGISNELFLRLALSVTSILFGAAVNYLRKIASDLGDVKRTIAVIGERSNSHDRRLDKLETAVFNSGSIAS